MYQTIYGLLFQLVIQDLRGPCCSIGTTASPTPFKPIFLSDNSANPKLIRVHETLNNIFEIVLVHINTSLTDDISETIKKDDPYMPSKR